jgi:hypothetical protein
VRGNTTKSVCEALCEEACDANDSTMPRNSELTSILLELAAAEMQKAAEKNP